MKDYYSEHPNIFNLDSPTVDTVPHLSICVCMYSVCLHTNVTCIHIFGNHLKVCCSVQSLSRVPTLVTPWTAARQASLSITNSQSLPRLMSIELVMPSNDTILCRPLFLLPSVFPSFRVFSSVSVLRLRWLEYWNFSFPISPSNDYSGLISFWIDWFDLLTAQETLKSLLQHHS